MIYDNDNCQTDKQYDITTWTTLKYRLHALERSECTATVTSIVHFYNSTEYYFDLDEMASLEFSDTCPPHPRQYITQ